VHEAAALDEEILRISLDAKATIKLGMFSRKGRSRVEIKALDHDFSKEKVHLFGLFFPAFNENHFFLLPEAPSLTADAMVDCLEQLWAAIRPRFPQVKKPTASGSGVIHGPVRRGRFQTKSQVVP